MEPKWFLKSKTIWGLILSIFPMVATILGLNISGDDAVFIGSEIDKVIAGVGSVLVLIGRFKSTTSIKLLP